MMHPPHNNLFLLIADGNEDAFRKFVHDTYKTLFPFAASIVKSQTEAEDVLQDVFLKIWLRRDMLPSVENPTAWVHTIIANTAANYLRTKLRNEIRIQKAYNPQPTADTIDEQLEARFTQLLIDEAVSRLPVKRKEIFLLNRTHGLSRKEIAARMHISENTVRNQLAEAVKFVQQYLDQHTTVATTFFFILYNILKDVHCREWYS